MKKMNRRGLLRAGGAVAMSAASASAQGNSPDCACTRGSDGSPLDTGTSELRPMIERFFVELRDLQRVYPMAGSSTRHARLEKFYSEQLRLVESVNFDSLSQAGRVDYLLLRGRVLHEQKNLASDSRKEEDIAPLMPFQPAIIAFEEARRRMDTLDPQKSAIELSKIADSIEQAKAALAKSGSSPAVLNRAAVRLVELRRNLKTWFDFYHLYDPRFAWWADTEFKRADDALNAYAKQVRTASGMPTPPDWSNWRDDDPEAAEEKPAAAATDEKKPALGSDQELSGVGPVGNDALVEALRSAMVAYAPDELIDIANREFAWCDREMLRASGEMGFGSDWKKAVEAVKNKYVDPGQMIYLVRDLSREAIDYLEKHDLVGIPPLVKEDYWEEAMTPRMQLVNPFFTGGATIQVSSPASSQTLQQRLEALRGNNMFFARATVFHELIPGHHMQFYMMQRYRTYRNEFSTPFWTEGMAFYWEMLLWDLGFTHTPEQRVGALVWRMHRCARIVFSLSFHLKKMTALECVQFLMDRVGFDHANAEGEVRRSFNGSYPPIYQCAYMLGALQFYALHRELVGSGKMTNRAFHDAMYREGNIPVEMLRLALNGQKIARDYETSWKFYQS
ncbi:MAG TPA: DUF885 family protein [Bryobacteraceae bacterium]|nr:DUF885 family protein [Bryobacteraceae bacterium]